MIDPSGMKTHKMESILKVVKEQDAPQGISHRSVVHVPSMHDSMPTQLIRGNSAVFKTTKDDLQEKLLNLFVEAK